MLLYPFRKISNAVPHNRRHRMVGIAGYKCIICKKRPKLNGHIPTMCNKLIEFVMDFDVKLLSNAIAVLLLAFSTPIWIPVRRCRVSRPKTALWKPFFHIANRLFNINAVQLTMLCKQATVSHGLSRLSAAALPAGHTCPPQPHIFGCPRRPAPRASPAPPACAARIAPSCTVRPATRRAPPHTIPHRAQKAPGAFAPGAGCYGAAVPAHAPMSWQ